MERDVKQGAQIVEGWLKKSKDIKSMKEKAEYVKEIAAELKLDENSIEGMLLNVMTELLADMSQYLEKHIEFKDLIEEHDEDIYNLKDELYELQERFDELEGGGDDEEDISDDRDDLEDKLNELKNRVDVIEDALYGDEEEGFDEGDELYECVCPSCGDTIRLDENVLAQGEIACPGCGEVLEFDFDESEFDGETEASQE